MNNDHCNHPLTAAYSWGGDSTAGMINHEAGYVNSIAQVGGARRSRTTKITTRISKRSRTTKRTTRRSKRSKNNRKSRRTKRSKNNRKTRRSRTTKRSKNKRKTQKRKTKKSGIHAIKERNWNRIKHKYPVGWK